MSFPTRPRALFAAVLLLTLVPTGARAFHDLDLPVLASGGAPGHGWVALKFDTDGSRVGIDIGGLGSSLPNQYGLYVYTPDDELVFGFSFTAVTRAKDGVVVDVSTPAGPFRQGSVSWPATTGFTGMGLTLNPGGGNSIRSETRFGDRRYATDVVSGEPYVGSFKLLLWAAGDEDGWIWSVRGGDGVSVARDAGGELVSTGGESTHVAGLDEFRGAANSQAAGAGVSARASVAATKTVDVDHTFIGWFSAPTAALVFPPSTAGWANADRLRVSGPAGVRDCPCSFWSFKQGRAGPGTYVFEVTGAGAGYQGLTDVFFGGVDAVLPE